MITVWSLDFYRHNGFVDGMQGRYLTGAIVTFAVLLVAALGRWQMALRLAPPVSVVAAIEACYSGCGRSGWTRTLRMMLGPGGRTATSCSLRRASCSPLAWC